MKNFGTVVLLFLMTVSYTVAQQPEPIIKPEDFSRTFWDGWRALWNRTGEGLRYTETRGDWVLAVESDRNGSARASYVNTATGFLDSECVVVGDKMYERSGSTAWAMRTVAEYKAEQAAKADSLTKARAANDHATYSRIFAAHNIRATNSAMMARIIFNFGQGVLNPPLNGVIAATGSASLNGRIVKMYKLTAPYRDMPPTLGGSAYKVRHEREYWFDERTGAIAKARSRNDTVVGSQTTTEIVLFEWHIDHSLAITPPIPR